MANVNKKLLIAFSAIFIVLAGCSQQPSDPNPQGGTQPPAVTATPQATTPPSSTPPIAGSPAGQGSTPSPALNVYMGKITAMRLSSAQSGWIGGDGFIARTDDGGKTWHAQYIGNGTVSQLFALNDQDAWAAIGSDASGQSQVLLRTTDGGKHWVSAGTVPNKGFLHFVSKTEAYNGNAKTTDGGKTWTSLSVPSQMMGDAYFHDKEHGWAVTTEKDSIAVQRTEDGGRTWGTVMSRKTVSPLTGANIRSAGTDDAWVEWIGQSGMTQTSYSVFHTADGGKNWQTVIANFTAGAGPAPGFPSEYSGEPNNKGTKPGTLYVVNPNVAFMGGQCLACDTPNTIGWTKDGGKTWTNGDAAFEGYGEQLLAIADVDHGWWICTDYEQPSVLYTTIDGGKHWTKVHTFDMPKKS